MSKVSDERLELVGTFPNVFGWGDRGETKNPHVEWKHPIFQNQEPQL